MKRRTWSVNATVIGGKWIGEYEAETGAEAIALAMDAAHVSLCHQCTSECEDPAVTRLTAECRREDGGYDVVEEDV